MSDNQRLALSLTLLQSVDSFAELENVLQQICRLFRVKHMAFLVVRTGATQVRYPCHCTTYPKCWIETYLARDFYETDPVIDILTWSRLPVDWSELGSEKTRPFFEDARKADVGVSGMTIPLRGPGGERCLFSVSSDLSGADWSTLKADSTCDLINLSHFLHDKVLSEPNLQGQRAWRPLSTREKQCLQHLAAGLIPKQIAANLSISESSVRLYLRSARQKLGAKTSHQAVAWAGFCEMISL